jgi:FixJ family two-component response regulator
MDKVLFVDDDENLLIIHKRNYRNTFHVITANSAEQGLSELKYNDDIKVIVSDYDMPVMNGIEFLSKVKEIKPNIVRVIITGRADLNMAIDAVNEGSLFRFITKPCEKEKLQMTISQCIEQYKLIVSEKELLEQTLRGSVKVLIDILTVSNPNVFNRSVQVREYVKRILKRLSLPESWEIDIACLLSKIGCIGVPNNILEKKYKGQPLSPEEETIILSQAEIGKSLLKNIPRLGLIAEIISLQFKSVEEINQLKSSFSNDTLFIIPKLLKILNEYFLLIDQGNDSNKAIEILLKYNKQYDNELVKVLETELGGKQLGYILDSFDIKDLKEGMILAEDLYDEHKFKIFSKGIVLSGIYISKLVNYSRVQDFNEKIKVLVKNQ